MAKYRQEIEFGLTSTFDSKGFKQLQNEIAQSKQKLSELSKQKLIDNKQFDEANSTITKFQQALDSSFNNKLGLFDASKFKSALKDSNVSIQQVKSSFDQAGATGTRAFNNTVAKVGQLNTDLKTTSTIADKLFTSINNNIGWQISTQIVNGFQNALSSAYDYVKDLDDSLTQIMLVTDYSRQEMDEYAHSANEAAKALGATTTEMTNASLIFAQQGFDLNQSQQLAEMSTKLANASQQDTSATSDQITAYMNAYGLQDDMDGLKKALDAWAEVANISAADVGEIAEASQRVASTAATTGVTMDQLNAQIATIESVTREAPEFVWALVM